MALARWQQVFGGELRIASYGDFARTDGPPQAVAHGELVGPVRLAAADAGPGDEPFSASGVLFALLGTRGTDVLRRWFADLSTDGTVVDALQERPWGDWDGTVRDAFARHVAHRVRAERALDGLTAAGPARLGVRP